MDAAASYARERVDYYVGELRLAEYRRARVKLNLAAGYSLPRLGQLRAGWRYVKASDHLETGLDIFSLVPKFHASGWQLSLDLDSFDRLYFPRRGWAAQASWFDAGGAGYSRQQVDLRAAVPWGEHVLGARVAWTGSARGRLPLQDAARLGGFLNLTGYANGQFIGDDAFYGHLRLERIVGRLPLGMRGDMRIGLALEAGRMAHPYTVQQQGGWLASAAIYLGGETPIGPAYVGLGHGRGGATNAYLFIGTP